MRRTLIAVTAVALFAPLVAHAQSVRAAGPLPGYKCMALNITEQQLRSGPLPPVLSAPSATAPRLATASMTVIAADPPRAMNGYLRVLHLDGREGWVEASKLRAWRSLSDPNATCTPAVMSDGRPGTR